MLFLRTHYSRALKRGRIHLRLNFKRYIGSYNLSVGRLRSFPDNFPHTAIVLTKVDPASSNCCRVCLLSLLHIVLVFAACWSAFSILRLAHPSAVSATVVFALADLPVRILSLNLGI